MHARSQLKVINTARLQLADERYRVRIDGDADVLNASARPDPPLAGSVLSARPRKLSVRLTALTVAGAITAAPMAVPEISKMPPIEFFKDIRYSIFFVRLKQPRRRPSVADEVIDRCHAVGHHNSNDDIVGLVDLHRLDRGESE